MTKFHSLRTPTRLSANDSYTFLMKELEKVDEKIREPLTSTDWPRDMPVITGTTVLGGAVSIRKSDNAFAIGTGDTFVALPNVRVSAVADGLKNTELLLTERNIL